MRKEPEALRGRVTVILFLTQSYHNTELNVEAYGPRLDADTVGNGLMQEKIMTPNERKPERDEAAGPSQSVQSA